MLLAIDIGNTNITLAVFDGEDIIKTYRLTSKIKRASDEYGLLISEFLAKDHIKNSDIDDVVIASVVPKIMHSFNNAIRHYLRIEPLIIDADIKMDLSLNFDNPLEVGADRIADAMGAKHSYQGDLLVVDFGTATTFEVIDHNGVYQGGCICPGVEIMANALSQNTAKLPEIEIKPIEKVLAKNTSEAMQAGIYYGYLGLTEHIIQQFKDQTKLDLYVVATGGLGRIIANNSTMIDVYDRELTFKGLKALYDMNKETR